MWLTAVPSSPAVHCRMCQDSPSLGNRTIPHWASRARRVTEPMLVTAGWQAASPPSLGAPQCCQLLFTQNTEVGRCFFQALKQCLEWPDFYTHGSNPKQLGAELGDRDTLHSSLGGAGRKEQFQPLHMSQSKSKQHNHCCKGVKATLFIPSSRSTSQIHFN